MVTRFFILCLLFSGAAFSQLTEERAQRLRHQYANLPLHFEPGSSTNSFQSRASGFSVSVRGGAVSLLVQDPETRRSARLQMQLIGANATARAKAEQPLPGKVNYLLGNDPRRWRRNLPTFERVRVLGVLPGVDLLYYGTQRQLEYDFLLSPGASPASLVWQFSGADSLTVTSAGELRIATAAGPISWRRPVAYQQKGKERLAVEAAYRVLSASRVGFSIGEYDRSLPLIIDPVLEYSTVLGGGSGGDFGRAIAVDGEGNAYITGRTESADFAIANAFQTGNQGSGDAFVTKLNALGTAVIFSTYLGGTESEEAHSLALDAASPPNVYIAGRTASSNFPVLGAAQPAYGGNTDGFLTKLSSSGNSILYSTYHGGSGFDVVWAVAVHRADGSAFIAGQTNSANLPVANAYQATIGQNDDAFLAKFSPSGATRTFSTYLGRPGFEFAYALAVDSTGSAYVAGETSSNDFPNSGGVQPAHRGDFDAFVTKFNPSGASLTFSLLAGGSGTDRARGIALDSSNNIYLTGITTSSNFPIAAAIQPSFGGVEDAFITKISSGGNAVVYSTYLGGPRRDQGIAIAVDSSNRAHVIGNTGFLPSIINAVMPEKAGATHPLLRSTNNGASFSPSDAGTESSDYGEFTLVAFESPQVAYAIGQTGDPFRSSNGGSTWTRLGSWGTLAGNPRAIYARAAGNLWVVTDGNLYQSTNDGASWTTRNTGLPASPDLYALAFHPSNPNEIYAASNVGGVYRSTNGGAAWVPVNTGLTSLNVQGLFLNPTLPTELIASTSSANFLSTDSGVTWTALAGLPWPLWGISRHPQTGELFASASGSRPVVSVDNGRSWTFLPRPAGIFGPSFVVDPANAQHFVFGSNSYGIWRSVNRGLTWQQAAGPKMRVRDLAFAPGDPSLLLAALISFDDLFVARLEPAGNALSYLTYFGTDWFDGAGGVATDANGNTYVSGFGGAPDLPITNGAVQQRLRAYDGFVAKISPTSPPCSLQLPDPIRPLYPFSADYLEVLTVSAPAGCPWSATSSAPWLRVLNGTNRTASGSFAFTLETNTGAANRSADLTVGSRTFRIEQAGTVCATGNSLTLSTAGFPVEGGTRTGLLTVPAGCPWRSTNSVDWVTVSPSSGTGPAAISVTVPPNPSRVSRFTSMTIGPRSYSVTQVGFCSITFSAPGAVFTPSAATGQFTLSTGSGCPWTLSASNSNVNITSPLSGTGPATVTYALTANPVGAARSAVISADSAARHTVLQNGSSCLSPSLFDTARTVSALATTIGISVTGSAGCGYTAASSVPWATLTSAVPMTFPGFASFSVDANPGPGTRVTTLTVAGLPFTLTQLAPACSVGITSSVSSAPASGITGTLTIGTTGETCGWTATSSASWLRFTSPTTGSGNSSLSFVVDPNPSPSGRSATLSVNGQTISIVQAGVAPCQTASFSLSQATDSVTANGGTRSLQLNAPAGCPWAASSADPWVTVTSAGNGPSTLTLNVQSNPTAAARSTTLTVAGLPFIVQQAAPANQASCTLAATPLPARAEGRTELLGDLLLSCSNIPLNVLLDLDLALNTTVTSPTGAATLTVNTGSALASQASGYNRLRWPGLRLPAGNSVLRISNVRADASLLATPASLNPVALTGTVTLNSATPLPLLNSTVTAATATPGLVRQPGTPSLSGQYRVLPIVLSEGFATAFRTGSPENTRLRIAFPNVPSGVRIFAPVHPSEGTNRAQLVSADQAGLGGGPVGGSAINGVPYQEISAPATWQVATADANVNETLTFPFLIQNANDAQFSALLSSAQAAIAPLSPIATSQPLAPLPRFRDFSQPERRGNLRITSRITADPNPITSLKASPMRALFAVNTPIVITLNVTNETEQVANNTTVRNNLPTGLLLRNCSIQCTESAGQLTVPLGSLAPGETRSFTINATVGPILTQGGAVSNIATVSSDDPPANLASASSSASIDLLPGPPAVALPEPISGTGLTKTFVLHFSNPNGFQRLGILNALINNALDGGNACYIAYSVPAGILFLVNDRGVNDGLSAPLVLGTNNSVANSQCTINGLNSSAFGSGNDFTLTLEITFRPSFSGNKIVYLAARDEQERNSGWTSSGFHEVPGGPTVFPSPQMTPPIGTTASGILSFIYEDQTNNANLQTLWALANTALDGLNACYVVYFAPGNLIGVVPDNGDGGALSLIPLSGSATTGNSQCQINTFGSSVIRNGNRLTLNLNMTFRPTFSGNRIFWLAGQTVSGQVSPWKASGAWQVPP